MPTAPVTDDTHALCEWVVLDYLTRSAKPKTGQELQIVDAGRAQMMTVVYPLVSAEASSLGRRLNAAEARRIIGPAMRAHALTAEWRRTCGGYTR